MIVRRAVIEGSGFRQFPSSASLRSDKTVEPAAPLPPEQQRFARARTLQFREERMAGRRIMVVILPVLLAWTGMESAVAAPDLGIHGSRVQTDCAGEESCTEDALTARLAAGGHHRLRASLSALRVRSPSGVARTVAGLVPLQQEQVRRRQGGSGSRSGGAGSGRPAAGPSPVVPEAQAAQVPEADGEWVSGAGDLYVSLTSRVSGGGSRLFALDVEVTVKAPTASEERALGTGEWDGRLGLAGERRFWSVTLFGGLGWSRIGDPEWAELKDAPDGFIGLESEPLGPGLRWAAWLEGIGEVVEGAGSLGSVVIGCRSQGSAAWRVRASAGLTRSSEVFGISMGLSWGSGRPAGRTGGPGT
jgi:hypothetical protein